MAKKVTVYSSDYCPFCDMAKNFLKENKVAYEERNVQVNPDHLQEMVKKTGQRGVPVLDIDGKIIIGFNVPKIKEALGLK